MHLNLKKQISAECNVVNLVGYYFILHCPFVKCDNKTVVYSVKRVVGISLEIMLPVECWK